MRMKTHAMTLLAVAAAVLLAEIARAEPQTKERQTCINAMNKDALGVYVAQGKEDLRCAKADRKDDAATDLVNCLTSDPKLKVSKKQGKTTTDDGKKCTAVPAQLPEFGYTGAATINPKAKQIEIDLMEDMFKDPNVDAGIYPCDNYPNECECQDAVHKIVEKLMNEIGKKYNRCKKNALIIGRDPFPLGAGDPNELADCVDNAAITGSVAQDDGGKLKAAVQKIVDALDRGACNSTDVVTKDPFPGPSCNRTVLGSTPTDTQLANCLAQRAYCHFLPADQRCGQPDSGLRSVFGW
jgi:hypothetical protein